MNKLSFIILLLFSVNSHAINWVEVFSSSKTGNSFYVDVDRVKTYNGYTYFWVLANFSKPLGDSRYLSAKVRWKANCKEKKRRKLSLSIYKKINAVELLGTYRGFEWEYPKPSTIAHSQLMFACNQKQ